MAVHVALEGLLAKREERVGKSHQDKRHKTEKISFFWNLSCRENKDISCHLCRADLFARLQELVESTGITKVEKPWDRRVGQAGDFLGSDGFATGRLVVECSGVAEPESIAAELEAGYTMISMMTGYETA